MPISTPACHTWPATIWANIGWRPSPCSPSNRANSDLPITLQPAGGIEALTEVDREQAAGPDEPLLIEVLTVITGKPRTPPWGAYLARNGDGRVAGLCCFK